MMTTDPFRERDPHGLGIDATVHTDGATATVTLPVDKLDRLIDHKSGHEDCASEDDLGLSYDSGVEAGKAIGRKDALTEIDAFLAAVKASA